MAFETYNNGSLIERGDDADFKVYSAEGVYLRDYTQEELDQAADQVLQAERQAVRQAVRAIVNDLKAEKTRCQEVIDSSTSSSDARKVARAAKRIADAAIDLAKFVKDAI